MLLLKYQRSLPFIGLIVVQVSHMPRWCWESVIRHSSCLNFFVFMDL